jgi:hypothetical protein
MRTYGDTAKPIWMTEFGEMTAPATIPGATPSSADTPASSTNGLEAQQAQLIHDVYASTQWQAAFLYQLRDTAVYDAPGHIIKLVHYGIVTRDYAHHKLGFDAYKNALGGPLPSLGVSPSAATSSSIAWYWTNMETSVFACDLPSPRSRHAL